MQNIRSDIEVVITGLTRNQVIPYGTEGSNPSRSAKKERTFVYQKFGLFLSNPQAWHIIAARSAVYIISPFGAVYHHALACIFPAA